MKRIVCPALSVAYLLLFQGVAHSDQLPGEFAIRSIYGNFFTAVGGGGRTTDAIHSDLKDASRIGSWEKFKPYFAPAPHRIYTIQTMTNHLLTAVDGGGRTTEPVFQTDRLYVGTGEQFNLFKREAWHFIRVSNGNYARRGLLSSNVEMSN